LQDSKLRAFFVNHSDFARSNPVIHSNPVGLLLPEIPICDNSP
jgi:hypothetical protein